MNKTPIEILEAIRKLAAGPLMNQKRRNIFRLSKNNFLLVNGKVQP